MGKKDGGAGAIAAQDRADEAARQASIRAGTSRINSIFDGGNMVAGDPLSSGTQYDPTKTYYNADGSVWSPSASGTSGDTFADAVHNQAGGANPAAAFADALSNGGQIYGSVSGSPGFNDAYYDKQRQNYIDYATPQLNDQYADAQKQLTFALTRGNLLDSSARAQMEGDLQKKYDLNAQQIADQGLSYENQAKNSVEDARSNLIQTLNSTGDANGAANQAIARASALSAPPSYSALTNLFTDFTNTLGTQAALEKANALSGGATGVRYNTGLFAPNPNSVQVQ